MRPSLLATAAVLCALWACSLYPAAATELVHVASGELQANYSAWPTDGRRCVVATAQRAPLVLTGSEGGP